MDENIERWVSEAVEYFEDDGKLSGDAIKEVDRRVHLILDRSSIDGEDFCVSDKTVGYRIQELLGEIRNEGDPVSAFDEGLDGIKENLGKADLTKYTVTFPLAWRFKHEDTPDSFTVCGTDFEHVPHREWENSFLEEAEEDQRFGLFLEKSPNNLKARGNTFWKVEYEAGDHKFAVDHVADLLGVLLGKMNFAMHYRRNPIFSGSIGPYPSGISDLKHPFVYMVFGGEEFDDYYYSTDALPRKTVNVKKFNLDRYNEIFSSLPDFSEELGEVDKLLISGLQIYHSGVTEPKDEDAFLEFWRGLELLTLVERNDSSYQTAKRAGSILRPDNPNLFDDRLRRLKDKRNDLVHQRLHVNVSKVDVNLAKTLLESLVTLYVDFRDKWDKQDFRFVLHKGGDNPHRLRQLIEGNEKSIAKMEREIELVEELIDMAEDS